MMEWDTVLLRLSRIICTVGVRPVGNAVVLRVCLSCSLNNFPFSF